jgi:hypothetical protein
VLPGVGPLAGSVAKLRTAVKECLAYVAQRLTAFAETLRGPGGPLYVFHEPVGTSSPLGGAAANVWPPVFPHGPAFGPPSVGRGGPPSKEAKTKKGGAGGAGGAPPAAARLLFVSMDIREPRLLVEAVTPGTTAVVFDPAGLEEPGGLRRLLLAAEEVLNGATVTDAAVATTGTYFPGGGVLNGGYLTARGDEDVKSFWKTASREVFGRQGTWHFICDGNEGPEDDEFREEEEDEARRGGNMMAEWGKATRTECVAGQIAAACDGDGKAGAAGAAAAAATAGKDFFDPAQLAMWWRGAFAAELAEREDARRAAAGLEAADAVGAVHVEGSWTHSSKAPGLVTQPLNL